MAQELKAYGMDDPEVGDEYEMYKVSDVDAVLAENDEKIDELQKATDSAWSKVNAMYDEIRHHKYKRCMDKVKQCTSMMIFNSKYGTDKKWHLFKKWRERWRELAEKFKEAK